MLDTSAFRRVRRRMLRRLLPDFAEERAVYRRRRDGQLHVVELAPYLRGCFKANLGLPFEVVLRSRPF